MPFPVPYPPDALDERGLFVVQDPALRARILPLFSFDPRAAGDRPVGHGTAFRIDPWSRCATAFHVVEDWFELNAAGTLATPRPDFGLAALELDFDQIAYGSVPLPENAWRPIAEWHTVAGIERLVISDARLRNLSELIALRIDPRLRSDAGTPFLPTDLQRWRPTVGEQVLALGYADLDRNDDDPDSIRPISQYLYGSFSTITDIEWADGDRSSPWPFFRVEATWPGGMSGGPMFNEAGNVIGLVSRGFSGQDRSSAAFFSGWDAPRQVFGSLDALNPGHFWCYGAFDVDGELARCGQDRDEIERYGREAGLIDFGLVSVNPSTGDYMRE